MSQTRFLSISWSMESNNRGNKWFLFFRDPKATEKLIFARNFSLEKKLFFVFLIPPTPNIYLNHIVPKGSRKKNWGGGEIFSDFWLKFYKKIRDEGE